MLIKTLIVEDDPMVSGIIQKLLAKIEHMQWIGTAKHGQQALDLIHEHSPALILLDIYMPTYSGLELLREIRRQSMETDVILITAADNPQIVEESMRLGIVEYIIKPFDFDRFDSAIEQFKKRYSMFRRHESVNQQLIDSLHGKFIQPENAWKIKPLPKGIDPLTLRLIREHLTNSNHPLSAQEIADHIQLSRITTRKYLEYLCEINEISLDLKYSDKGRPTKIYVCNGDAI